MPVKGETDSSGQNKTMFILVTVIIVILCIGGGIGVALWQLGIFSSDTVKDNSMDGISNENVNDKQTINNSKEVNYEEKTVLQHYDIITTMPTPISTTIFTTRETKAFVFDQLVTQNNLEATVQLTTIEPIPVLHTSTPMSVNTMPTTNMINTSTNEFTTFKEGISYQEITMLTTPFIHVPTEESLILTGRN